MTAIPEILIISDESYREDQSIELAKAILAKSGLVYEIDYIIEGDSEKRIKPASAEVKFEAQKKIIICCGLDTVNKATRLKSEDAGAFLVCIQDPSKKHEEFDLIVIPEHDFPPEMDNVVTTLGIINHVNDRFLNYTLSLPEHAETKAKLEALPNPRIAVLLGGKHIGGEFGVEDAKNLATKLDEMVKELGGSLMITTSRRTESEPIEEFKKHITVPHEFYDYNYDGQDLNPYNIMLALSDAEVITADSVRMCSEAASTGKPTIICIPEQVFFPYGNMARILAKNDCARIFADITMPNDLLKPTVTLNEAEKIAKIILQKMA
ncbi:MAG: hypothetical protein COV36_07085 [Alphaproteobacteria bacterium CG11_big_fil_rev_8_21_14_0_20_44_7]|nr:MAG: hypothetical protein COV36_07085 [Alphaproteobacteria bacterium CG11_big_fil_rev_8_21_14_0_20_44_7]